MSQKAEGLIPDEVNRFFNSSTTSRCTMALGSTQPTPEINIENLPGGKGKPPHKADNFTAICEPTVRKLCDPTGLHGLLQACS
jgi:hypothetical protein